MSKLGTWHLAAFGKKLPYLQLKLNYLLSLNKFIHKFLYFNTLLVNYLCIIIAVHKLEKLVVNSKKNNRVSLIASLRIPKTMSSCTCRYLGSLSTPINELTRILSQMACLIQRDSVEFLFVRSST